MHEADLGDERWDAPEAAGLDVLIRGPLIKHDQQALLELTAPLFARLYELKQHARMLGREP